MKNLKFRFLKIQFKDGAYKIFNDSVINHIETDANSLTFRVKIFVNDIKAHSHIDEYIYEIDQIKEIEQRWERED